MPLEMVCMMYFKIGNDRAHIIRHISELPSDEFALVIEKATKSKTRAQRNYFHKCARVIADNSGYTLEEVKRICQDKVDNSYESDPQTMWRIVSWMCKVIDKAYGVDYLSHFERMKDKVCDLPIHLISTEKYTIAQYAQMIDEVLAWGHQLQLVMPKPERE